MAAYRKLASIVFLVILATAVSSPAQERRGPFTAAPRSVRSRDLDQQHIRLEMRVDLDKQQFQARAVHRLTAFQALSSVTLDAVELKVQQVRLASSATPTPAPELKFEQSSRAVTITLDRTYQAPVSRAGR